MRGRSVAAEQVDHIIPIDGADDPLFWDESNHQSLCRQCHGLKSWRENRGWVVDWSQRMDRMVITGKPGTGKREYADGLRRAYWRVWDPEDLASRLKLPATRTANQWRTLLAFRGKFEREMESGTEMAVIIEPIGPAYAVAKRTRATLVHCWADEQVRLARLAEG